MQTQLLSDALLNLQTQMSTIDVNTGVIPTPPVSKHVQADNKFIGDNKSGERGIKIGEGGSVVDKDKGTIAADVGAYIKVVITKITEFSN